MALSTQSFKLIVSNAVAAVQGAASSLVDFTQGSISLAYVRASAGIALWLQALVLQTAALTRLATSSGSDVDTFLADFSFKRLGAAAATGTVTFARFTPTAQALIAPGKIVQTADGTQQFMVIADTGQAAWNAGLNAYVIAAGVSSCAATVQAVTAGSGGNVAAGLISVIGQSIVGVDTVTNAAPFTTGVNAQSDTAARASFAQYISNLTLGTLKACRNAVLQLQVGATCSITTNVNYSGIAQPGYFYAVCDDGSGTPSPAFLSACYAAIDAVRAEGTMFGVFAPVLVTANVAMTVTIAAGFTGATVRAQVNTAITAYINSLAAGALLQYSKLPQIAYDASAGVANVPLASLTLNSATADLTSTSAQLIRSGTIVIS